MERMKLSEYLDSMERGARAKLAAQIGAHASDLSDWINGNRPVPVRRCASIEVATDGAVTRRDLRPDDWHLIWPELAKPARKAKPTQAA
jgi:DNA-binding transcriptional regulator YdaS (Cro superfamily)